MVDYVIFIDIIIIMKIINNTDINNLILFSKKNLGIYKLVYKEYNKLYWLSLIGTFISIFLLIIYILLVISHINNFLEKLCGISCLVICLCTCVLLKYIDKIAKSKHLKIQNVRFKLLKKYYHDSNYNINDIKIINEQLEKRIAKIEKQKVTILIVIGTMILPTWDIFIQYYFNKFSSIQIIKFIIFCFIFSLVILSLIRVCNKTLYLYEENFYKKNNIALIENLIYLNKYIIQEKEEQ